MTGMGSMYTDFAVGLYHAAGWGGKAVAGSAAIPGGEGFDVPAEAVEVRKPWLGAPPSLAAKGLTYQPKPSKWESPGWERRHPWRRRV